MKTDEERILDRDSTFATVRMAFLGINLLIKNTISLSTLREWQKRDYKTS